MKREKSSSACRRKKILRKFRRSRNELDAKPERNVLLCRATLITCASSTSETKYQDAQRSWRQWRSTTKMKMKTTSSSLNKLPEHTQYQSTYSLKAFIPCMGFASKDGLL